MDASVDDLLKVNLSFWVHDAHATSWNDRGHAVEGVCPEVSVGAHGEVVVVLIDALAECCDGVCCDGGGSEDHFLAHKVCCSHGVLTPVLLPAWADPDCSFFTLRRAQALPRIRSLRGAARQRHLGLSELECMLAL